MSSGAESLLLEYIKGLASAELKKNQFSQVLWVSSGNLCNNCKDLEVHAGGL